MPSTTPYKQGDVLLVPFPFTNQQSGKQRPALVISSNWYNRARSDLILLAFTSKIPQPPERDQVALTDADLTTAHLPLPSVVRAGKIFTIDKSLIIKPLGHVTPATLQKTIDRLIDVITGK
jgi:mRNA interferase MazF